MSEAKPHPLQLYRETHGISRVQMAEKIGSSDVQVWRIENGTRQPSLDLMQRIFDATEGKVTPNDFLAEPAVPEPERLAG